nr:MAG TPA: hypothetical protein [Caudoviricetes sp.]
MNIVFTSLILSIIIFFVFLYLFGVLNIIKKICKSQMNLLNKCLYIFFESILPVIISLLVALLFLVFSLKVVSKDNYQYGILEKIYISKNDPDNIIYQIKLNNGKEVLAQGEYVPTDLAIKNKVCLNYHIFKGDVNYYNLRIVEDLKCNQD